VNVVEVKNRYEMQLLDHGAAFVSADPDTGSLIIGVKDASVIDWAKKHIHGVKLVFINVDEMRALR